MLPRAQGEFPSLGSAELGLEEGAAVQIQAGICSPFAGGSKDTHGCCRCFHCSVLLPFARRKLSCSAYRHAVSRPCCGALLAPGQMAGDSSTAHLIPGEEQPWCTLSARWFPARMVGRQGGTARSRVRKRRRSAI